MAKEFAMSKYVDISQVEKLARDVTLANGIAKYRCIDPTLLYELSGIDIVRCKDCRYCSRELNVNREVWSTDESHLFCHFSKRLMRIDDFCSWGERKEDD